MPEPKYADKRYRTLQDVADAVGVSRQRVHQVVRSRGLTLTQAAAYLRENAKLRQMGTGRTPRCSNCGESGHYRSTCGR